MNGVGSEIIAEGYKWLFFHHLAFASILKMYGICRLAACVRLMCFILKSPDAQCEWACTFTLRGKQTSLSQLN